MYSDTMMDPRLSERYKYNSPQVVTDMSSMISLWDVDQNNWGGRTSKKKLTEIHNQLRREDH